MTLAAASPALAAPSAFLRQTRECGVCACARVCVRVCVCVCVCACRYVCVLLLPAHILFHRLSLASVLASLTLLVAGLTVRAAASASRARTALKHPTAPSVLPVSDRCSLYPER